MSKKTKAFNVVKCYGFTFKGYELPMGAFYGIVCGIPYVIDKDLKVLALREFGKFRVDDVGRPEGFYIVERWVPAERTIEEDLKFRVRRFFEQNPDHKITTHKQPRPIFFADAVRKKAGGNSMGNFVPYEGIRAHGAGAASLTGCYRV